MPRPMMFFVPAILVMPVVTVLLTGQTSVAEPAVDECKTEPGSSAPPGSHWYYRVNRADQRHCWYLGPEGAQVRSQARKAPARASSPTRMDGRENALETARPTLPPIEPAQRTPIEPHGAAADYAATSSDLPKTRDLDAREPTTSANSDITRRSKVRAYSITSSAVASLAPRKEEPTLAPTTTFNQRHSITLSARRTRPAGTS